MEKKGVLTTIRVLAIGFVFLVSSVLTVHAAGPMKFSVFYGTNPKVGMGALVTEWFKNVDQATNGKIQSVIYGGGVLSSPLEVFNNVKSGAIDMAVDVTGLYPGQFPLAEVMQLPFLDLHNTEVGSRVYWGLFEKFPEFRAQFEGVHVLVTLTSGFQVIGSNKPIRTLEDMKGQKIRVLAGPPMEMVKALGGTPVLIPPPDIYTSMERKVIDGWMWSWEAGIGLKLTEVTNYFTQADTYQPTLFISMNQALWDKLPPDVQNVFNTHGGDTAAKFFGKALDEDNERQKANVRRMKDKEVFELTAAETERWKKVCQPVWNKWAADVDAKGLPGKAVLEEALSLSAKFAAE